jgi:hypothetical protein
LTGCRRAVRLPGAAVGVRPERLRRDPPRAFEYDIKRMTASFMIAGRNNGFPKSDRQPATDRSTSPGPGGHLAKSRYKRHGERVAQGQRMMQATSDIFLGWTKGADTSRHYNWRQLRDMKGSAEVEAMAPVALNARIRGWTLAGAHARSGDPVAIADYLARTTSSTGRSPTSPSATPTRTSATTRRSRQQSDQDGCTRSKAPERSVAGVSSAVGPGRSRPGPAPSGPSAVGASSP